MRPLSSNASLAIVALFAQSLLACWNWDHLEPVTDAATDASVADEVSIDAPRGDAMCGTAGAACCGAVCNTGLICMNGTCAACAAGQVFCGASCVEVSSDPSNCGGCGNVCAADASCNAGHCVAPPPANDTRDHATVIDTSVSATTLTVDTSGAHHDTTGACACTTGNDVFYQFTLSGLEIVYVDTIGSTFDTAVFLQDSAGNNIVDSHLTGGSTCSNDGSLGCNTGSQSLLAAKLFDGTYYLVLSGCGAGQATLHFQHLPVGSGSITRIMPVAGSSQQFGDSVSGSGTINSTCCSDGPENTYWFVTCPSSALTALHASTCGAANFDTEIDERSASRTPVSVCNDNACGMQSQIDATIPAGAGLHAIYLDSCSASVGSYTLSLTFGACTTGSLCYGNCVDLQTNPLDCGSCGQQCAPGGANTIPSCTAGVCGTRCATGFADCNGFASDGCETSLDDPDHCGSCGNACSRVNDTPSCSAGACSLMCNPGYGDCDGMISTGCEAAYATDRLNCGGCNHRCVGTRTCVAGNCQ